MTKIDNSNTKSGGVSFLGLLALVFIVLKLTSVIAWSWWWVLLPLWGPIALALLIMFIGAGAVATAAAIEALKSKPKVATA